jgi:hypothetical protein
MVDNLMAGCLKPQLDSKLFDKPPIAQTQRPISHKDRALSFLAMHVIEIYAHLE